MAWTKIKDRIPEPGELIVMDSMFHDRFTVFEVTGLETFYKDRRNFIKGDPSCRYLVIPKPITTYDDSGNRN